MPIPTNRLSAAEHRWLHGIAGRIVVVVTAVLLIGLALPELLAPETTDASAHTARHLATWQIGFGVGLIVAATISRWSYAVLAMAMTVGVLSAGATIVDVATGHQGPLGESVHLIELAGVVMLWFITPPHLRPRRRRTVRSDDSAGHPPLRATSTTTEDDSSR